MAGRLPEREEDSGMEFDDQPGTVAPGTIVAQDRASEVLALRRLLDQPTWDGPQGGAATTRTEVLSGMPEAGLPDRCSAAAIPWGQTLPQQPMIHHTSASSSNEASMMAQVSQVMNPSLREKGEPEATMEGSPNHPGGMMIMVHKDQCEKGSDR